MYELKFRGYHVKTKKMYSPEELAKDQLTLLPTGEFINVSGVSTKESHIYSKEFFIPMQYIGLKDKNGKEIYEGDIISLINDIGKKIIVICERGIARREISDNIVDIPSFYFRCPAYGNKKTFPIVYNYAGKHDLELFEIIGNIHENPELLGSINEQ